MPYGIYVSAEGAFVQSQRLETIANNLANVTTAGFKRDLTLFQARFAEAIEQGMQPAGSRTIADVGGGVAVLANKTDFSQGPLQETGLPTDLAIEGRGFFVVKRDGQDFLTRAGNFALTGEGMLTTQDGFPVLSDQGDPIVIDPNLGPWTVTRDGIIAQGDTQTVIQLVEPASLGDLAKAGQTLFKPLAPVTAIEPEARRVAKGFVEQSGVNPTLEMMEMIETSRVFEANVNMMKHRDQILGALVTRVLKV